MPSLRLLRTGIPFCPVVPVSPSLFHVQFAAVLRSLRFPFKGVVGLITKLSQTDFRFLSLWFIEAAAAVMQADNPKYTQASYRSMENMGGFFG